MLIQPLTSLLSSLTVPNTKVHLAQHNGFEHPMDVYLAGDFDEWQSWQSRRNYECEYVIGLVATRHEEMAPCRRVRLFEAE